MSKIKGVILSVEDILVPKGKIDSEIFAEVDKLIRYFRTKKRSSLLYSLTGVGLSEMKEPPLEGCVTKSIGENLNIFVERKIRAFEGKPTADATKYVLDLMGWESTETLYIGASINDMQTAVNGELLFFKSYMVGRQNRLWFRVFNP